MDATSPRLMLASLQDPALDAVPYERVRDLVGRSAPRMGYVGSSVDRERVFFERKQDYYSKTMSIELNVYVDEESDESEWAALASCDAIHLSGGNAFAFARWLRGSGRLAELRRSAESGCVLIGESAGSILCTSSVEIASLCGDERSSGESAGLGLVSFGFWPHFTRGAERNVTSADVRLVEGVVYGCPDGGAVIVDGAGIETYGNIVRLEDGLEVAEEGRGSL